MSPSFSVLFTVVVVLGAAYADTNEPGRYKYSLDTEVLEKSTGKLQDGLSRQYTTQYMDIVNLGGTKYFFSNQLMSWMEALSFCMAFNMDITSIETSAENALIEEHLTSIGQTGNYFWASANKIGRAFHMWLNGQNLIFSDFFTGQPGSYNCIALRSGYWYGRDCAVTSYPILYVRSVACSDS